MFSVNLINYNNAEYVQEFIDGLEEAMEGIEKEIVLVDNESDDGSWEELESIADIAVQRKTTRGEARNLCLKSSSSEFTIDCLDTDQRPQPVLGEIAGWFLKEDPDFCLTTNGCMINRRDLVEDIGFGNYQAGEDKYLWDRLIDRGRLVHLFINTAKHINGPDRKETPIYSPKYSYPWKLHKIRDKELEGEFSPTSRK